MATGIDHVRLAICSNQPILVAGIERLIAAHPGIESIGAWPTVSALKEELTTSSPDLALVDLTAQVGIEDLNGLQVAAPNCKVILWADAVSPDFALQALTAGIRGILRKTLPVAAHIQCLQRVHAGDLWFEKSLTENFQGLRRVTLTPRESQLVSMLSRGMKNKEIAALLGLTEGTVKVYLAHLFQKAGAKDRFDMAILGLKSFQLSGLTPEMGGLHSLSR